MREMTPSYKILHPSGRVSWFVLHVRGAQWFCVWDQVKPWRVLDRWRQ